MSASNDYLLGQIDGRLEEILKHITDNTKRVERIEREVTALRISKGKLMGAAAVIAGIFGWIGGHHG